MPVLIAGMMATRGALPDDIEARLRQGLEAMNFGPYQAEISTFTDGPCAIGRVSVSTSDNPVRGIAAQDGVLVVGDFRVYDATDASYPKPHDFENENQLSAATEAWLAKDPARVSSLNADFAAAIWEQEPQRLSLARDALGIRPLIYQVSDSGLVSFASFPMGLSVLMQEQRMSKGAFLAQLFSEYPPAVLIDGQRMVPAGTRISFAKDREPVHSVDWHLPKRVQRAYSFEDAVKRVDEMLDRAIAHRQSRFAKTASHVSGGLDSTSIALKASALLEGQGKRLLGLTLKSDQEADADAQNSEYLQVVSLVQKRGGMDLVDVPATARAGSLAQEHYFEAQTQADTESYGEGGLAMLAQDRGADVILSGLGGDQFVSASGFSGIPEMALSLRWVGLWRHLKRASKVRGWSPWRMIAYHFRLRLSKGDFDDMSKAMLGFMSGDAQDAARAYLPEKPAWREQDRREQDWRKAPLDAELLNLAILGARHCVRYAFPLLDRDLVEFSHQLPAEYFLRDGHTRTVMRGAMKNVLDDDLRLRAVKGVVDTQPMSLSVARSAEYLAFLSEPRISKFCTANGVDVAKLVVALTDVPSTDAAKKMDQRGEVDQNLIAAIALLDIVKSMSHLDDAKGE